MADYCNIMTHNPKISSEIIKSLSKIQSEIDEILTLLKSIDKKEGDSKNYSKVILKIGAIIGGIVAVCGGIYEVLSFYIK